MRNFILIAFGVWALLVASDVSDQVPPTGIERARGSIMSEPPEKADLNAMYLFYLHGRIVQEQGRQAVSPKYGSYEYDEILDGFAAAGFVVISEVRPRGMDASEYAGRVVMQVEGLLRAGVPARRVTIVGASMGGYIAMLASSRVTEQNLGYVIMGICNDHTFDLGKRLHGDLLSIFETSDELGQSCAPLFARAEALSRHAEVRLDTGLHHGFLYRPLSEWMGPVTRWARERGA